MYRFSRSNGAIVAVDQRYMSIGTAGAGKEKAWDRKTPLGVYPLKSNLQIFNRSNQRLRKQFPSDCRDYGANRAACWS